ncbi:MAG: class I SAM-dependent methyltransferase [Leptospiraceae bacterium]|nr:class I SAM-dependent methyltransferase [Leptospiraceae bacterium]
MNNSRKAKIFEKEYWETLYVEDEDSVIDGLFNSYLHAKYAKSLFDLVDYKISTLCDIGFGLGFMLRDFCKVFKPKFVLGLEPSFYCIEKLQKHTWYKKLNLVIINNTFQNWDATHYKKEPFDLTVINSVIQYFPSTTLEADIQKLSEISKFVYLTLPTKKDYIEMKKELNFVDPYANARTGKFYKKLFSKYFYFISYNLLESKCNSKESPFTYELFRF